MSEYSNFSNIFAAALTALLSIGCAGEEYRDVLIRSAVRSTCRSTTPTITTSKRSSEANK